MRPDSPICAAGRALLGDVCAGGRLELFLSRKSGVMVLKAAAPEGKAAGPGASVPPLKLPKYKAVE